MGEDQKQNGDILIDTMIKSIESQGKALDQQREELSKLSAKSATLEDQLQQIAKSDNGQKTVNDLSELCISMNTQMADLGTLLQKVLYKLKNPSQVEVRHHHHIPTIVWASSGLFIIVCVLCCAWYNAEGRLEKYQANDIKYRKLKLEASSEGIKYLSRQDSIFEANPDSIRNLVVQQERWRQERQALNERLGEVESKINPTPKAPK